MSNLLLWLSLDCSVSLSSWATISNAVFKVVVHCETSNCIRNSSFSFGRINIIKSFVPTFLKHLFSSSENLFEILSMASFTSGWVCAWRLIAFRRPSNIFKCSKVDLQMALLCSISSYLAINFSITVHKPQRTLPAALPTAATIANAISANCKLLCSQPASDRSNNELLRKYNYLQPAGLIYTVIYHSQ